MAVVLAPKKIRVNCINPGLIDTSYWERETGKMAAAFAVYAGDPGHTLTEIERLLKHEQFEVFLTGGACYPNNWAQMMNPPGAEEIEEIVNNGDNQARIYAVSFIKGERNLYQIKVWAVAGYV